MKKIILTLLSIALLVSSACKKNAALKDGASIRMSKNELIDKIKGGWAGQVIGVTYGGPTEFRFKGTMIQPYYPIPWTDSTMKWWYDNAPGLYDDVYMDITFVDVFQKYGIDAPVDSHAMAYARADYKLWHANQVGRYNILNGIMPPMSGHWKNNPHADCIDFQIEADFAGLMSPAMPNTSSQISDGIGHIMNYGDGWYGGVYVAAMYTMAFVSKDVEFVVTEALKTIPAESEFHKCMSDVIAEYKKNTADWRDAWYMVEKKWSQDMSCPDGIFDAFNIDAKVNCAYAIIGLLYGKGDYGKTLDIATRCGQDSDCNPATAGGILGTMLGYNAIPAYWKQGIDKVEDMDFKYTTMSLNDVYKDGTEQAIKVIEKNGGKVDGDLIIIKYQKPIAVRFEKSFPNIYPSEMIVNKTLLSKVAFQFNFTGTGIIVNGSLNINEKEKVNDPKFNNYIGIIEATLDDQKPDTLKFPANVNIRRNDFYWKYELPKTAHTLQIRWLNVDTMNYNLSLSRHPAYSFSDTLTSYVK